MAKQELKKLNEVEEAEILQTAVETRSIASLLQFNL